MNPPTFRYLCLSRDVAPEGYRKLDWGGKSHLLTRSRQGNLFLDENTCRHRGFPVADQDCGTLPLRCPYHDLVFHGCGEMPVVEEFGMVFTSPGPYRDIHPRHALMMKSIGEQFAHHRMIVEAPAYLWMQNTMDPGHLHTVHKKGFARNFPSPLLPPHEAILAPNNPTSSYAIKMEEKTESFLRFSSGWNHDFMHMSVFPNLSMTNFMGIFTSVERVNPLGRDRCEVLTRFFLDATAKPLPKKLLGISLSANQVTLEEDKKLCERWFQGGYNKTPKTWLPGEERVRHYFEMSYREHVFPESL